MRAWMFLTFAVTALAAGACGSSDPGLINCAAYIDRMFDCGLLPEENRDQLYDTNVLVCNGWENNYKTEVMTALDECIDEECDQMQMCAVGANQLCVEDVTDVIEDLCEKIVECGWEQLVTMEICREELTYNQGLYMCWREDVQQAYVDCVQAISCSSEDSEYHWYECGFEYTM